MFWIVYNFVKEVNLFGDFNSVLRELQTFMNGRPSVSSSKDYQQFGLEQQLLNSDLEIPYEKLQFQIPLGGGEFGIVYKANMLPYQASNPFMAKEGCIVAVKMMDEDKAALNPRNFRALLYELKILNYLGRHENVVSLIGACTSMVKSGKLYVVVEYCSYGSVEGYIRCHREDFDNIDCSTEFLASRGYLARSGVLQLEDLAKWAYETACGMEYITSKNVIHGDLAARNVLLTDERVAKIADFSLSRQLFEKPSYLKLTSEPLPWRHLAPESLESLTFSSRSEVWSFGVTLWEYFSCGNVPHAGIDFGRQYIMCLKNGYIRLNQPQHATDSIYKVMTDCWNVDPDKRPTFSVLKETLKQIQEKLRTK